MSSSIYTACRDINELSENAQKACKLFLEKCRAQNLNILITETYRSQERQNYLYEQGRTRSGKVVTWTKNSRHTSRRAWDICKNVKGHEYDDTSFFKKCGQIAKELNITWGGTWKNADTPHFEIDKNWKHPEEENKMTDTEKKEFAGAVDCINKLTKIVEDLQNRIKVLENPMIYNYIDDNMPEWARPTIQKLVDKHLLHGDDNGLHLTDGDLKQFVVNDRKGLYD